MSLDAHQTVQGERATQARPQIVAHRFKPLMRGLPDVAATVIAVPAAASMTARAASEVSRIAAAVYCVSLVLLFAVSATYHTPWWPIDTRKIWRRVDHATIFVLIAGTYTPISLLILKPADAAVLLTVVWVAAFAGVLKSFFWPTAPRWLNTSVYLAIGWAIAPFFGDLWAGIGLFPFGLIIGGGLIYSLGSLVYVRRWPNPWPLVFGYHEVFHLFVIAAAACHFAAIWVIVV